MIEGNIYRLSGAIGVLYLHAESKKKAQQQYARRMLPHISEPVNRENVRRWARMPRAEKVSAVTHLTT